MTAIFIAGGVSVLVALAFLYVVLLIDRKTRPRPTYFDRPL